MAKAGLGGGIGVLLALGLAAWLVLDSRSPHDGSAGPSVDAARLAELEAENEFLRRKLEQLEAWRMLHADRVPAPPDGPALSGAAPSPEAARRHEARRTGDLDPSLSPEVFIQGLRRALKVGQKNLIQSYRTALFALGARSVPPLLAILRDPREGDALRIEILAVLQVLQADALHSPVREMLEDPRTSPALQQAALQQLPIREGMQVPAIVMRLAEDTTADWTTRQAALRILVGGAPGDAEPVLRRMVASGEAVELVRALKLLEGARSPVLRPLITELVERPGLQGGAKGLLNALAAMKGKSWATVQMTGPPDTPMGGDLVTAWASKAAQEGDVWVELDYERSVVPEAVRVHETFNAGAVKQVLARQPGARWHVLWQGAAAAASTPRWFEPPVEVAPARTRTIRIVLDTNAVKGWNEIDAVELVGDGYRQWAAEARASSSYAGE